MNLELIRDTFTEKSTTGVLFVDGKQFCFTLEDKDRKLEDGGIKVFGKTCIPRGTYSIVVDYSPHYQRRMPHILNVPSFQGIRIHSGNTDIDTEGCILVGSNRGPDTVINSRIAFNPLFDMLDIAYLAGGKITIVIK